MKGRAQDRCGHDDSVFCPAVFMLLQNIIKSPSIKYVDEAELNVVINEAYVNSGVLSPARGYTRSCKDS